MIAENAISDIAICEPHIPSELTLFRQWICWRWETCDGKRTKVPINPRNNTNARVTDNTNWGTFDEALTSFKRYHLAGVGFVFTEHDPYVGIDLDSCLNPETDILEAWATKIIDQFATYSERSPSGTGIKLFCKGRLPTEKTGTRRPFEDGAVEMYHRGRFFTVTGHAWPGTPSTISDCQSQIDDLWEKIRLKACGPQK